MSDIIETKPLSDSDMHMSNAEKLSEMWSLLNNLKGTLFQLSSLEPRLREALYDYNTSEITKLSAKMDELSDGACKSSASIARLSNSIFSKEDFSES